MAKSLKKIQYEKMSHKDYLDEKALTVEDAKKIIGWRSETDPKETVAFGNDYKFKDRNGVKTRLDNAETQRPFRMMLALQYANEMLRNEWGFTPDCIAVDVRGNVQTGMHRIVGLILAEQIRQKDPKAWKGYGTHGPLTMECGVYYGTSDADKVVDKYDLGQKRSLGDVFFRNRTFTGPDGKALTEREQQGLTNTLANAARVVWLCLGGKLVSDALKFLHSEALNLVEAHPKLIDCVNHINIEDAGSERQIRSVCSMGTAAGLMYLMGASKTNTKKWEEGDAEVNFDHMEKAEEFWTLVASGASLEKGHPCLVLRNHLKGQDAGGGKERDAITASIKLAWNAFIDGKKVDGSKAIKAPTKKIEDKVVIDMPYMGGLDVHHEAPPKEQKPTKEEKAAAKKAEKDAKAPKNPKKAPKKPIAKKGKNTKTTSYPFTVGDEVWVHPSGKDDAGNDYELYQARVAKIHDDGRVDVVFRDGKYEFEAEVDPKDGDYIGHDKPAKAA